MTNSEIIFESAKMYYGEDVAMDMMQEKGEVALHTFLGWKKRGYSVKKGEHAAVTTRLWKYKKGKELTEEQKAKMTDEEKEKANGNFFLTKAFLFAENQVEAVAN